MTTKYVIDHADLEVDHADEGEWRSYHLSAQGNTLAELLADAHITEVDQDGGELNTYHLVDARDDVSLAAFHEIEETLVLFLEPVA